jgi:AcrR family transcriptional regulator
MQAALELFSEHGYEQTTMRAIAERAGVSLGNSYYYFPSKEHLIQAFYARTHADHLAHCRPILAQEKAFKARLLGVMRAKIVSIEPYHRFAGVLFRTAADPQSPLNPFSAESRPVRQEATQLFADVVSDSTLRVAPDLARELPNLLWIYHMGIILYWIHDASPNRARTYRLVEESVDLISQLIRMAGLPILGQVRRNVLRLIADIAPATE